VVTGQAKGVLSEFLGLRAASADKTVVLKAPRDLSLEAMLEFVEEDEWVEVTPGDCRLRKRILNMIERKRANRTKEKER
jgi:GTP-binding protein